MPFKKFGKLNFKNDEVEVPVFFKNNSVWEGDPKGAGSISRGGGGQFLMSYGRTILGRREN